MDGSVHGKIYFRPKVGNRTNALQEYAYTSSEAQVNYHHRILGTRHIELQKWAKLQPKKSNKTESEDSDHILYSLYDICMYYIVSNLHLVDSFVGLPSLIGEEIFDSALARNKFSLEEQKHDAVSYNVNLFMEAYNIEMLQSVNLSGKWKFLAFYLDQISIFLPFITEINFSSCKIGNGHEILIELGKLHILKKLSLDKNDFGNDGIKNLTQKRRRAKSGLDNLEVLSILHNNKISPVCLVHLQSLPLIKVVSMSMNQRSMCKHAHFSAVCPMNIDHRIEFDRELSVEKSMGNGWGCKLLEQWLSDFKRSEERKLKTIESRKRNLGSGISFYKKTLVENSTLQAKLQPSDVIKEDIMLCTCGGKKPLEPTGKKRKHDALPSENKRCKSGRERVPPLSTVDDSSALFDMYKIS